MPATLRAHQLPLTGCGSLCGPTTTGSQSRRLADTGISFQGRASKGPRENYVLVWPASGLIV